MKPIITGLVILLSLGSVNVALAKKITVRVKEAKICKEKVYRLPFVATVKRGDLLEEISMEEDWYKVKTAADKVGWIKASSVLPSKVELTTEETGLEQVAEAEVTLAGKGFNEQVEREYREENPDLDFDIVDQIEKIGIDERDLEKFILEGKLQK
ncbi:MAG: hypothetical protein V3W08_05905 [Candidatus Binatia bacterium]|jgi:hypothetical protein